MIDCFSHLMFKKHDVAIFHIIDRAELKFEMIRPVRFQDMEGGENLIADPVSIRDEYLKQLHQYMRQFKSECFAHKVDYRLGIPDEGAESLLSGFLLDRLKGGSK